MKVLVIGSGGREHALAWKLAQSSRISKVFVAPGNAGTAAEPKLENLVLGDTGQLIAFVRDNGVQWTVVGPEAPLAAGIVDRFRDAGLKIFGPTRAAARLESSKDFAKQFMARHNIPSAAYQTFDNATAARAYVSQRGTPIVIKADGLAAGKGVVVAGTVAEAHDAIDHIFNDTQHSIQYDSSARVVIEDFLSGEEASFIVMADGRHALALASSQDHKRLLDGDQGPNTGGMGAYSPAPVVTQTVHDRVMQRIILPTLRGMAQDGTPYSGFLYAGLMIDEAGNPQVIEFNCRMGDPETQPIMMRLQSDFSQMIEAALTQTLDQAVAQWDTRTALGVVLAAAGYPEAPHKGDEIDGLPLNAPLTHVFHAGTAHHADGKTITSGGRVLCVTALGHSVSEARHHAYAAVDQIRFDGCQYRRDIGHRAVSREP